MVNSVTIHYTAGPTEQTILDVALYQIGPTSHEPFPAIAYHIMVDGVGDYHLLHDLDRRVWHSAAPGANSTSIGICYNGIDAPNDEQIKGLRTAIRWCEQQLRRPLEIFGHKDKYPTQCPSGWPTWKDKLKQ